MEKYRPLYRQTRRNSIGSRRPSRRSLMQIRKYRNHKRVELERTIWTGLGFLGVIAMIFAIGFLIWLQKLTKELPPVNKPPAEASSVIYDRNGVELYRVSSDKKQSDWLTTNDYVPELQKWAFLAAEDEEFYNHGGVDFTAIVRCVVYRIVSDKKCGGSTISQQVVVNTMIARENTVIRKIKEVLLTLQLERLYDKDEIMNIYLNVVPEGSNVVGIKRGADFYFHKNLGDLSLEQMVVLSAIVQDPNQLSPTVGSNLEANKDRLYFRTDYILKQMEQDLNRVNERIDIANAKNKDKQGFPQQEHLTKERIEEAKKNVRELVYEKPTIDIKAPHFIFYVQKLLTDESRGYNNGKAFTPKQIQNGGLKIYTTLDYSLQEIAEEYVESSEFGRAGYYRNQYGASNSALMTMNPSTGEILTMVGSKCYKNDEYINNCDQLDQDEGKKFDPDVNVLDTLQSPGSTNKAIGYYIGFNEGIISTGSILPDVPITSIPGYSPKNWDGKVSGFGSVRNVFAQSLNMPALFLIEAIGVQKYVDTARTFGYTTYNSPEGYGPSVILGGTDVKGIEHAQAFGVFANGGDFVKHEVILKITDIDGNVIYEHKPEKVPVADPAAVYLVNNVLNPRVSGSIAPTKHMLDRDVAGKTGTSEGNRDTWFVMWSPDFVTLGWMGNNDNTRMSGGAFGSTTVQPWVGSYMDAIAGAFPNKTPFVRPAGIVSTGSGCPEGDTKCVSEVGLGIAGKNPPNYLSKKQFMVCTDQPDHLARQIDIASGYAFSKEFYYLQAPNKLMQGDVDAYMAQKGFGAPTQECNIPRDVNLSIPQIIINSPVPGTNYKDTVPVDISVFLPTGTSIDKFSVELAGNEIYASTNGEYKGNIDVSSFSNGPYTLVAYVTDSNGDTNSNQVRIIVGDATTNKNDISLTGPSTVVSSTSTIITATYSGNNSFDKVTLYQVNSDGGPVSYIGEMRQITDGRYEYRWVAPTIGKYDLYAIGEDRNTSVTSNRITISIDAGASDQNVGGGGFAN